MGKKPEPTEPTSLSVADRLQDLREARPMVLVLVGHLLAEGRLNLLLRQALAHPEELPPEGHNMRFPVKAKLCVALGLVPRDRFGGLEALNELRNKFAHRLDWELTTEDVNNLKARTSPYLRGKVDELAERFPPKDARTALWNVIASILTELDQFLKNRGIVVPV